MLSLRDIYLEEDEPIAPTDQDESKLIIFKQQLSLQEPAAYYQIKKDKINFNEEPATSLMFLDMTQFVTSLTLQSKFKSQKVKNLQMQNYSAMMQHEFRTPLATCIMFI